MADSKLKDFSTPNLFEICKNVITLNGNLIKALSDITVYCTVSYFCSILITQETRYWCRFLGVKVLSFRATREQRFPVAFLMKKKSVYIYRERAIHINGI